VASYLTAIAGIVALVTAIAGATAGLSAYVLYTVNFISADSSANLILVSVVCALVALLIGFAAWRLAERRAQESAFAQGGIMLAGGTLGAWFVVVVIALGK
jgi:Na+/melibiose symporter-like transporter